MILYIKAAIITALVVAAEVLLVIHDHAAVSAVVREALVQRLLRGVAACEYSSKSLKFAAVWLCLELSSYDHWSLC
jgi:hypothetical protein